MGWPAQAGTGCAPQAGAGLRAAPAAAPPPDAGGVNFAPGVEHVGSKLAACVPVPVPLPVPAATAAIGAPAAANGATAAANGALHTANGAPGDAAGPAAQTHAVSAALP